MRRNLLLSLSIAAFAAAGCASAGATTPPGGATAPPLSSGSLPTIPPLPSDDVPLPSFVIPSFAIPSFNSDADLAARFPQTIAGGAVEVQTVRAIDFLQFFEDDPEQRAEFDAFISAVGVPVEAISIGTGSFTYEGSSEQLQALRAAGADGARLLNALVGFTKQTGDDPPSAVQTTTGTIGGKPVTILTIPDDTTSYLYGAGDIVWLFESDDPALADQVMGAIP